MSDSIDPKPEEDLGETMEQYYARKLATRFPKPGAKLRYKGAGALWFTDIIANAERELRVGEIYTLKTIRLASSWAPITLEETGDTGFALSFFEVVP